MTQKHPGPNDEIFLICALATAPTTIKGSVFDHVCIFCGARLMVAPDGQDVVKQFPNARTVCVVCALYAGIQFPESPTARQAAYLKHDVIPNPWRTRN